MKVLASIITSIRLKFLYKNTALAKMLFTVHKHAICMLLTLCDKELLWLGEDIWVVDGTWPTAAKPLLTVDDPQGSLGVDIGPPAGWKWLFGVEGREFVGVKHVTDADRRCWTIFWQAEKIKITLNPLYRTNFMAFYFEKQSFSKPLMQHKKCSQFYRSWVFHSIVPLRLHI